MTDPASSMNRETYIFDVPRSYRGIITRAWEGSRAAAVKAKCLQCRSYKRNDVRDCNEVTCALHAVRPYQAKPIQDAELAEFAEANGMTVEEADARGRPGATC